MSWVLAAVLIVVGSFAAAYALCEVVMKRLRRD